MASSSRLHLIQRLDAYVRSFRRSGPTAVEVTRLLFRCHHAAMDIRHDVARDHGLTPGALISLLLLRACYPDEPITPTALREIVMLSSGGMAKVLRSLEQRGLVTRLAHPSDARSSTLMLSAAGVELIDSIFPLIDDKDRELLVDPLTEREHAELIRLLGKIAAAYRWG